MDKIEGVIALPEIHGAISFPPEAIEQYLGEAPFTKSKLGLFIEEIGEKNLVLVDKGFAKEGLRRDSPQGTRIHRLPEA